MDVTKTIARINEGRDQTEASFVFSLWKDLTQYDDYKLNSKFLVNEDARFYYSLGKGLREQGFQVCDNITVDTYLKDKPESRKHYESLGGWTTCQTLMNLVSQENTDAYFDQIAKMNSLAIICKKYNDIFEDVGRFDKSSNEDVYDAFELLNNSVSLETGLDSKIENLVVDDSYIKKLESGIGMGLSYGKGAPLLNYITLGLPVGDIYLLAGFSGTGKSSFLFENIVVPLSNEGTPVAIVSNEMAINTYKNLLLIHVLTKEMDYWKITRKKLQIGKFSEEELSVLKTAAKITRGKYSNIYFVKMFESNTDKLIKHVKRLARSGVKAIVYDTLKADDRLGQNEQMWQQLLLNSRRLFSVVNKEQVAFVATFQLALHTLNQRYLTAACLASSKQLKEICAQITMFRELRKDEYTGEKYDCHPWRRNKSNPKIKDQIILDKDKKYIVLFIDKTRSDESGICLLYQWDGAWNNWKELGYCTIVNDYKDYN